MSFYLCIHIHITFLVFFRLKFPDFGNYFEFQRYVFVVKVFFRYCLFQVCYHKILVFIFGHFSKLILRVFATKFCKTFVKSEVLPNRFCHPFAFESILIYEALSGSSSIYFKASVLAKVTKFSSGNRSAASDL